MHPQEPVASRSLFRQLGWPILIALSLTLAVVAGLLVLGARPFPARLAKAEVVQPTHAGPSERRVSASAELVGECRQTGSRVYAPLILQSNRSAPASANLALAADPPCVVISQGFSETVQVSVQRVAGTDATTLSLAGLPGGATGTYSPAAVSGSGASQLLFAIPAGVATGVYTVTLSGTGGSQSASTELTLYVVPPLSVSGSVQYDTGGSIEGARVEAQTEGGRGRTSTTTGAGGAYSVILPASDTTTKVLISATATVSGHPPVSNSRWETIATRGAVPVPPIALPDIATARMTVTTSVARTADNQLTIEGLPNNISQIYGRNYEPDVNRDAFPGDFTESGRIPLNSSGFTWAEAVNTAGVQMHEFGRAVTMTSQISRTQWSDLKDITSGNGKIDIPIYTYDEQQQIWRQQNDGWLQDGNGTILPEDAEPTIVNGAFPGQIFAVYTTTHFSYMNVDYPYIGPWTLSRLDREKRNNDCLYEAMQLAKKIAMSRAGRTAYQKYNLPGADLAVELADGKGPELKSGGLTNAYGEFKGNEQGDRDDQLYFDNKLWDGCGDGATEEQKKNTTLLMAVTLVHETAHWKWDVKHDGGNWTNREPGGEAGNQLEKDLFGGIIAKDRAGNLTRDGRSLDTATRNSWLDPNSWPPPPGGSVFDPPSRVQTAAASPLSVTIGLTSTTFPLGAEIPVVVAYQNVASQTIQVLNLTYLEGYPLSFEIFRAGDATRVPFRGLRIKRDVDWTHDFTALQPGQTFTRVVTLARDPRTGDRQYNLIASGAYTLTAFYSPVWGLPETQSNVVSFSLGAGGGVEGNVSNAADGRPISGASVAAIQGSDIISTVTTRSDGRYVIPELPSGAYTFEASAPGFLRSAVSGTVTAGSAISVNFSLTPLLSRGELRFVLTWGESPSDLDSHLWLPKEKPYHLFYSQRGITTTCPWANLDVDDTSGFGPETITIRDRVVTGTYHYAIHNYSSSPPITASQAQVQVFSSSGLIKTFNVPTSTRETNAFWWDVLRVDGPTGNLIEVNQVVTDAVPYPSTTAGCTATGTAAAPVHGSGAADFPAKTPGW